MKQSVERSLIFLAFFSIVIGVSYGQSCTNPYYSDAAFIALEIPRPPYLTLHSTNSGILGGCSEFLNSSAGNAFCCNSTTSDTIQSTLEAWKVKQQAEISGLSKVNNVLNSYLKLSFKGHPRSADIAKGIRTLITPVQEKLNTVILNQASCIARGLRWAKMQLCRGCDGNWASRDNQAISAADKKLCLEEYAIKDCTLVIQYLQELRDTGRVLNAQIIDLITTFFGEEDSTKFIFTDLSSFVPAPVTAKQRLLLQIKDRKHVLRLLAETTSNTTILPANCTIIYNLFIDTDDLGCELTYERYVDTDDSDCEITYEHFIDSDDAGCDLMYERYVDQDDSPCGVTYELAIDGDDSPCEIAYERYVDSDDSACETSYELSIDPDDQGCSLTYERYVDSEEDECEEKQEFFADDDKYPCEETLEMVVDPDDGSCHETGEFFVDPDDFLYLTAAWRAEILNLPDLPYREKILNILPYFDSPEHVNVTWNYLKFGVAPNCEFLMQFKGIYDSCSLCSSNTSGCPNNTFNSILYNDWTGANLTAPANVVFNVSRTSRVVRHTLFQIEKEIEILEAIGKWGHSPTASADLNYVVEEMENNILYGYRRFLSDKSKGAEVFQLNDPSVNKAGLGLKGEPLLLSKYASYFADFATNMRALSDKLDLDYRFLGGTASCTGTTCEMCVKRPNAADACSRNIIVGRTSTYVGIVSKCTGTQCIFCYQKECFYKTFDGKSISLKAVKAYDLEYLFDAAPKGSQASSRTLKCSQQTGLCVPDFINLPDLSSLAYMQYTPPCIGNDCNQWFCRNIFTGLLPDLSKLSDPQIDDATLGSR